MNVETGRVHAGWGEEVFGHTTELQSIELGDKLQIRHWQMARSGEIKTSSFRKPRESVKKHQKRWGHVLSQTKTHDQVMTDIQSPDRNARAIALRTAPTR
jgi:hypothetical protein